MLVAAGDSCAQEATPTPPQKLSSTTDYTAAANARDASEGTSVSTGASCTHATPVTRVPTHFVTAYAPTTTPPPTSAWTTDNPAAANKMTRRMVCTWRKGTRRPQRRRHRRRRRPCRHHGRGQRHGLGGEHVAGDGGHVHSSHAGGAGGHALGHGAGGNDDAAAEVVAEDLPRGGGQRHGRGNGNVDVDGGLVRAIPAADAVGHGHNRDVADGISNNACPGGDAHMQRGSGDVAFYGEHADIEHTGTGEDESVELRTVRVGRLGGDLSLLGGGCFSCRGDRLSSLDAEDLRFLEGARSSSCSPEGLPRRSDLSCSHTSDVE